MQNFKEVRPIFNVCMNHILPQVYSDSLSYEELLYKILKRLNELVDNNNLLPEYIAKLIQEYISSGEIGEVVRNILADYMLNVKNPPIGLKPAVGDGSADDTEAIQGCINYANANGGKAIYFPSGVYLTQSLVLKSDVSLFAFDPNTCRLVLKGGATKPLISGDVSKCSILNLSLDGNMDIQVNSIDIVDLIADDLIINNVKLVDGYNLMKVKAKGCVRGSLIDFGKAVIDGLVVTGAGDVFFSDLIFHSLSTLNGRYVINNTVDNAVFNNIYSTVITDTAIYNNSSKSVFIGRLMYAENTIEDLGANTYTNFYERGGSYDSKLAQETQDRINADADLLFKINTEKQERIDADVSLNQRIDSLTVELDNEKLERIDADDTLNNKINTERQERIDADTSLNLKLDTERQERIDADTILNQKIDTEIQERIDADDIIQDEIDILKFGSMYANVKQFGAVGNGIADDTLAFQTAINTKKKVYIPSGKYLIKDSLKLYEESSIIGDFVGSNNYSRGLTLIDFQPPTKDKDLFVMNDVPSDGYYVYGLEISHLTITSTQGRYIFYLPKMSSAYIHDISYQGGFDYSIFIDGWIDSVFERCSFQGVVKNHINMVVTHFISTTVTFKRCYFSYANHCYSIDQGVINSLVFEDCIFESMNFIGESASENNIRFDNLYVENIPKNGVGAIFRVGKTGETTNLIPNQFVINGAFIQGNLTSFINTRLIDSGYITDISLNNIVVEHLDELVKYDNGTKRIKFDSVSTYAVRALCNGDDIGKVSVIGCCMPFTVLDNLHDSVFIGNTDISPVRSIIGSPVGTIHPVKIGELVRNSSTDDMYISTNYGVGDWRRINNVVVPPPREISGSPIGVTTPNYLGEEILDTTTSNWYKSVGLTNANWKLITNA